MADERTGYLNLLARKYKDDDEALRAAAGKVAETVNSPGWEILRGLLGDVHESYFKNLILNIRNQVPSQADYARATGFLAGVEQPQIAADAFEAAVEAARDRNLDNS